MLTDEKNVTTIEEDYSIDMKSKDNTGVTILYTFIHFKPKNSNW